MKENNSRVRWLTDEEEKRVFAVLPKKYHTLVIFALHTGMRKSEQLNLRWEDVDYRNKTLTIPRTKNGEARHVGMNEVVIRVHL